MKKERRKSKKERKKKDRKKEGSKGGVRERDLFVCWLVA